MNHKLGGRRVQMDGGGTRNQVEKGRDLAVKRGSPHGVHGDDSNIAPLKGHSLNVGGREGSIDAISELDCWGCEG